MLVADVSHLPFKTASFDAVICSEVVEHLPAVAPVLEELTRVSRHHVLLCAPREPYFRFLVRASEILGLGEDPDHVHFWSRRAFEQLLARHFVSSFATTCVVYRLALCWVEDAH